MTICFYINTLNGTGGTERATVLLANYLATKIDWNIYILAKQGGTKSFYSIGPGVKLAYLHKEENINIYKQYPKTLYLFRKFISKVKPDYVIDIGGNLSLESLPATILSKSKVISWEHFNAKVFHNYLVNSISKWLASYFSKTIVVLTEQDEVVYQQKFNAKRTKVIPYPVAMDLSGHTYNHTSKLVLAVGRLAPQKGFDFLLDAWSIVHKKHPDWILRIVGDGELKGELLKQRNALNLHESVEFMPSFPDVVPHFKQAAMLVMSSRYEGLPLILIEAKCFGLPIVSFDCETGPKQIIRHDVDGLLVETEKPELLAEGIITLIESPEKRKEFNRNALLDAPRFSPEVFYDRWLSILVGSK